MAVRGNGATDPASRIESVISRQERRFKTAFEQAIAMIRNQRTLDQLADLLEQGRFEEALDALDAAAAIIGGTYGQSLSDAAQDAAKFLSGALTVTVGFDQVNVRAVDIMQRNQLRLVTGFSSEQRRVTREALSQAMSEGLNPRDQARRFRDSVGLTSRQQSAVNNFRRLLSARVDGLPSSQALDRALRDGRFDRSIVRAVREGVPLTQRQIDTMVGRYSQRMVAHRATVIARTEALRATHEGTEEMYRQALDAGHMEPQQLTRTWVTARDERVRGSHSRLGGQEKPFGEPWQSAGGELRYPGDPNAPASETVQCRCALSTRIRP